MTMQFVMEPAGEIGLAPYAAQVYPGLGYPGQSANPDSAGVGTPPLTGDGPTMVAPAQATGGIRSLFDPGHPTAWLLAMGVGLLVLLSRHK
jgi:hypothetical protein